MIAILQLLVLTLLFAAGLHRRLRDPAEFASALLLLVWTDLVFTGLLLGSIHRLGDGRMHAVLSVILAGAGVWLTRRSRSPGESPPIPQEAPGWRVRTIAWLAILLVLVPTVVICIYYNPTNFDSVDYRFPRPFFYAGFGSLRNAGIEEFRISGYPFDIPLAYMPFALHGLGGAWFNLISVLTWLCGGCAVRALARETGASRPAALLAAALFMTAPAVLTSAASTNDDLIAGVPLAIGILFGLRWWRSAAWLDAALFAMGFGLSAGSKLHLPFLLPLALVFGLYLIWRLARASQLLAFLRSRAVQLGATIIVVGLLSLPVFVINMFASGSAASAPSHLLNKPFSLIAALATTAVSTTQLLLAPLPDLYLAGTAEQRQPIYQWTNDFVNRHLLYWATPDLHFSDVPFYSYTTITEPSAASGVWEQSAWLGLVPWLFLAVFALSIRRRAGPAFWLVSAFFGWHLGRSFLARYVDTAGIYYAFPAAIGCAALAWLWDELGRASGRGTIIVSRGLYLAVLAANLVSAGNLFAFNIQRNLPDLLTTHFVPNELMVPPPTAEALNRAHSVFLPFMAWGYPFFNLMSANPWARYTTAADLTSPYVKAADLSLLLAQEETVYGAEMPIWTEHDDRIRFAPLGDIEARRWDRELVFGKGPAMPAGWEAEAHWTVLTMTQELGSDGTLTGVALGGWWGVDPDEHYTGILKVVDAAGAVRAEFPKQPVAPTVHFSLPPDLPKDGFLTFELERDDRPEIKAYGRLPIDPMAVRAPGSLRHENGSRAGL